MPKKDEATEHREDYSRFVVHLTRDDTADFENGSSARTNLISIMKSRCILATGSHNIYNKQIENLSEDIKENCKVSCFTEVPLSQLHLLTQEIPGRKIKLEEYGLVFRKQLLIDTGAQPVIYVNSYNNNQWLREAAKELFDIAKKDLESPFWRMIPFMNAMHEKYDFSWEREWRVKGDFKYKSKDLVAVILPKKSEIKFRKILVSAGVACISPSWRYEQIVDELAKQQRTTKSLKLDKRVEPKTKKA